MSMFDTYDNIDPDYIPNNSCCCMDCRVNKVNDIPPRIILSATKKFRGYSWNHGEKFNLDLTAKKKVYVDTNAVVLTEPDEEPQVGEEYKEGQKAYNTSDALSWTYIRENNEYSWKQDEKLEVPVCGQREIEITYTGIPVSTHVCITNFRGDIVYSENMIGTDISIHVDDEVNKILLPGTYCLEFSINAKGTEEVVSEYVLSVT